jgi:hypothetical protein
MEAVLVQITNHKAYKLLADLEEKLREPELISV